MINTGLIAANSNGLIGPSLFTTSDFGSGVKLTKYTFAANIIIDDLLPGIVRSGLSAYQN
jgi:hypothetical protein